MCPHTAQAASTRSGVQVPGRFRNRARGPVVTTVGQTVQAYLPTNQYCPSNNRLL